MNKLVLAEYDHLTIQTSDIPDELKKRIQGIQSNLDTDILYDGEDEEGWVEGGLQKLFHTTILYGVNPKDKDAISEKVEETIADGDFRAKTAEIEYFDHKDDGYTAMVLRIESEGLEKLHDILKETFENKDKYPEYKTHVTIAYLKPNTRIEGIEIEPFEWDIDGVEMSNKDGSLTKIADDKPKCQECGKSDQVVVTNYGEGDWQGWECERCNTVVHPEHDEDYHSTCLDCDKEMEEETDIQLCQECMIKYDVDLLWEMHDNEEIEALTFNESPRMREDFRIVDGKSAVRREKEKGNNDIKNREWEERWSRQTGMNKSAPFKSKKQRQWMHIHEPEIAEKWEEHTPKGKELPERVSNINDNKKIKGVIGMKKRAGINPDDISYECNSKGYMMKYKGQNIGGAGTIGDKKQHWQHRKKNMELYRNNAEGTKRDILEGKMSPHIQEAINRIDQETFGQQINGIVLGSIEISDQMIDKDGMWLSKDLWEPEVKYRIEQIEMSLGQIERGVNVTAQIQTFLSDLNEILEKIPHDQLTSAQDYISEQIEGKPIVSQMIKNYLQKHADGKPCGDKCCTPLQELNKIMKEKDKQIMNMQDKDEKYRNREQSSPQVSQSDININPRDQQMAFQNMDRVIIRKGVYKNKFGIINACKLNACRVLVGGETIWYKLSEIEKSGSDLTPEQQTQFLDMACGLSPENLHCDGEVSQTVADKTAREILKKWRELEGKVGRRVTEDEVWNRQRIEQKGKLSDNSFDAIEADIDAGFRQIIDEIEMSNNPYVVSEIGKKLYKQQQRNKGTVREGSVSRINS